MKVKLWCWRCEVCGFEWLVKFAGKRRPIVPEQCPSKACRSRHWNGVKKLGRPLKDHKCSPRKKREVAVNVGGDVVGT